MDIQYIVSLYCDTGPPPQDKVAYIGSIFVFGKFLGGGFVQVRSKTLGGMMLSENNQGQDSVM